MQKHLKRMLLYGAVVMGSMMVGMTSCSDDDKENGGAVEKGHRKWVSKVGGVDRYAVQLWKGGPYWAEFNVGATIDSYEGQSITSSGSTFNQGDTAKVGCHYNWGITIDQSKMEKKTDYHQGTDNISGTEYDAARANWGNNWCMPDTSSLARLAKQRWNGSAFENDPNPVVDTVWCDGSTKKFAGSSIPGMMFRGKGGHVKDSIFFPAAGICINGNFNFVGTNGGCSSSVPDGDHYAWDLGFSISDASVSVSNYSRNFGRSVRAVCAK